jgi:hypothetical protein
VATAGSLWLGFSILRRDRKKEDRAQAVRVITYYVHSLRAGSIASVYQLTVDNTSDQPIRQVMLAAEGKSPAEVKAALQKEKPPNEDLLKQIEGVDSFGGYLNLGLKDDEDSPINEIASHERREFELKLDWPINFYYIAFSFIDARGVYWERDLIAGEMHTAQEWKWRKRYKKVKRALHIKA